MNKQIVYFSNSGNNKRLAKIVAAYYGITATPIVPVNPYPNEYHELTSQAKKERFCHIDVPIESVKMKPNIDTLILVSPIWYADLPRPIVTFLKQLHGSYQHVIFVSDKFMMGFGLCKRTLRKYLSSTTTIDLVAATSNNFSSLIRILE